MCFSLFPNTRHMFQSPFRYSIRGSGCVGPNCFYIIVFASLSNIWVLLWYVFISLSPLPTLSNDGTVCYMMLTSHVLVLKIILSWEFSFFAYKKAPRHASPCYWNHNIHSHHLNIIQSKGHLHGHEGFRENMFTYLFLMVINLCYKYKSIVVHFSLFPKTWPHSLSPWHYSIQGRSMWAQNVHRNVFKSFFKIFIYGWRLVLNMTSSLELSISFANWKAYYLFISLNDGKTTCGALLLVSRSTHYQKHTLSSYFSIVLCFTKTSII